MQRSELPNPVTPTKPLGNDGSGHDNQDAERAVSQSEGIAELGRKPKRQRIVVVYTVVKLWVTGATESELSNPRRILIVKLSSM